MSDKSPPDDVGFSPESRRCAVIGAATGIRIRQDVILSRNGRVTALICVNDIVFLSLEHDWLLLYNTGETWGSWQNNRRTVSRPRRMMLCKEFAHERAMQPSCSS